MAFLEGEGPDARGRTVFDVLSMDDEALERTHDYIQWLFPLEAASAAVPDAPVLTPEDVLALQNSPLAPCAMAAGTDRMDVFYRRTTQWLRPHDHNHLRITRIIRSLRLLRSHEEADAFRDVILNRVAATGAPVSRLSLSYWATA